MSDILSLFNTGNEAITNQNNVVLVDVSYFAHRAFHGFFKPYEKANAISIRYIVLNTILTRLEKQNIRASTHRITFVFDGRNYWKKVYAPYYKCRRAKRRDDGKDWEGFRKYLDLVREELIEFFPFQVLKFDNVDWFKDGEHYNNGVEADDVIAVVAKDQSFKGKNVTIFTGDGDFTQLDYLDNVTILNDKGVPLKNEHGCGAFDLMYKIVNGDSKDDVSNIRSRSNYWETKLDGERQVSCSQLAKEMCESNDPLSLLNEDELKRYKENRIIKDFNYIPIDIANNIIDVYNKNELNSQNDIYGFFYKIKEEGGIIQDNLTRTIMKVVS